MTPKEKAKELVDKYLCVDEIYDVDLFCDECGMTNDAAKHCALVAVDEIIKISHKNLIVHRFYENDCLTHYTEDFYWKKVKEELQKL